MASAALRKPKVLRSISRENFFFAMRAILAQKLRSALTLLGITAGVATVIAPCTLR